MSSRKKAPLPEIDKRRVDKESRVAEALRENLKRRKRQQQARRETLPAKEKE